jgi:SAM-dependent methyltransferase
VTTTIPIAAPDERVFAILAEAGFGADVFNPRQHRSCELVDLYALHLAIDLLDRLELRPLLARAQSVDGLLAERGFVPAFRPALAWLLAFLSHAGVLARDGETYHLPGEPPAADLAAIRAAGLESDPAYAPSFALLEEAAALYPPVARGTVEAEAALFHKVTLWIAYFSNANGFYALNNHVTAAAATARLKGAVVLEVGSGLGSAAEAFLTRLRDAGRLEAVTAYRASEPVVFFRRRAERSLRAAYPDVPFAFSGLDINQPWRPQGVEPGSCHLVWGVNVFHLARDLVGVLGEARAALAPGGSLVIGEGVRPFPGQALPAELPFQLLASYANVELDPDVRPAPGFLTAEHWETAFRRAGFREVEVVPDVVRLRTLRPGVFAAAICGR